jgi:hypothetical protein
MTPDNLPEVADAAYLTSALHRVLGKACVAEVRVGSNRSTILSRIIRLRLTYDHPVPDAPDTVILKTGLAHTMNTAWNGGRQEVEFYTRIAPMLPDCVVPRCFDAQWDSETGAWHLLLEDLTDTHVIATEWPLPASLAQSQTILTARAKFNAAWWDNPRLGVSAGTWLDAEAIEQYQQRLEGNYAALADRLGDILPPERRDLYRRFLDAVPRLFGRYHTHRNVTIMQGDSHIWNCFLPRDGGSDVRLFDWDAWRPQVAALDLSYMMAMHWYPDRRQRMERPLLDHYHAVLLDQGVTGYDRRALEDDYRWSVLMHIATPLTQAALRIPPLIWWNNLERILIAVDDLGCREFLS